VGNLVIYRPGSAGGEDALPVIIQVGLSSFLLTDKGAGLCFGGLQVWVNVYSLARMCVCVCVCVCARARARVLASARVRTCMCACV
jgi:hypothetical protein